MSKEWQRRARLTEGGNGQVGAAKTGGEERNGQTKEGTTDDTIGRGANAITRGSFSSPFSSGRREQRQAMAEWIHHLHQRSTRTQRYFFFSQDTNNGTLGRRIKEPGRAAVRGGKRNPSLPSQQLFQCPFSTGEARSLLQDFVRRYAV